MQYKRPHRRQVSQKLKDFGLDILPETLEFVYNSSTSQFHYLAYNLRQTSKISYYRYKTKLYHLVFAGNVTLIEYLKVLDKRLREAIYDETR